MNEKIKDFFQRNLGYFIVTIVSIVYIATAFVQIEETGKSIPRIIADGAIVFLLGFFINRVFDLQGIMNGERDERFQASMNLHGETVVKISPFIDKLDEWCKIKNDENLRVQRTRILATEGLKYSDYFNEDGSAKDIVVDEKKLANKLLRKTEKKRIHCFNKALHLKLTPISAGELASEGTKISDPYNFGRTKEQYEKQASISDIVSKIIIAVIFGYYGVSLIKEFSYANLIWNGLQVALFFLVGVIKMYNSYIFITDEYRGRIVKKVNNLEMFYNYIESLPKEELVVPTTTEQNDTEVKDNG